MAAKEGHPRHWTSEATRALITEVDSSPHRGSLIATGKRPKIQVWEAVKAGMDQKGYSWTALQLNNRWKCLKSAFHKERKHQEQHGTPSADPPEYYDLMLQIWVKTERLSLGCWQPADLQNAFVERRLQDILRNNSQMHEYLYKMSRYLSSNQRQLNEILAKPSNTPKD